MLTICGEQRDLHSFPTRRSSDLNSFRGGPVGLDTIAATIGEESQTIEDVYEPYLLQIGFLQRTSRGRLATKKAYEHFGIRSEEHTSELQSRGHLVCRLLLEKKK